jgi:hypothetical protein
MKTFATPIAMVLLLTCSLVALGRPFIPWDSWWYHLPFSARLWNIGGGAESFHLSPLVYGRWLGNPKAWEWIQGLVWWLTGSLYAIIVPQLLLCAAYFAYVSREYRVPLSWVVLAFFASPMLFIHFRSTYLDLPTGICVALGLLLLLDLLEQARTPGRAFPWLRGIGCIALLGLAGNIKYQGLIASLAVSGIVGIVYLFARNIPASIRVRLLAVLLIGVLVALASAIRNEFVFGNPMYPLSVRVHDAVIFEGPERAEGDAYPPTYRLAGDNVISLPQPVDFLLSATELDWTLRGTPTWYSIDSSAGMSFPQRGTGGSRTGGWGGLFFIANACLLIAQALRLRREPDQKQRLLVICTLILLVATAAIPRSHELRYWLYIPLLLIPVNLRYLRARYPSGVISGALVALMVYGVVHTLISPNANLLPANTISVARARAATPPEIVHALETTGRYCYPMDVTSLLPDDGAATDYSVFRDRNAIDSEIFRYSRAVTGLPGFISGIAADCPGTH